MADNLQWQRISLDRNHLEGLECFPLSLTAMEKFFVWDDQPAYPKRFQIVVDCDGILLEDKWIEAVTATLQRHPMLVAAIADYDRQWIIPIQPEYEIAFIKEDANAADMSPAHIAGLLSESSFHEQSRASNLRVVVVQSSQSTVLAFDVLHAACDGLGMRIFIEDATTRYNAIVQNDESLARWKRLEHQRLAFRNECPQPKKQDDTRSTTLREKLHHAYHFHFRGPYPINHRLQNAEPTCLLKFRSHELNDQQSVALREFLLGKSVGINEWATTCILETVAEWQQKFGPKMLRSRVMVPIDLRVWEDLRLSACNKIGFAFVVNEPTGSFSKGALLSSCKSQFEAIKLLCLGSDFVRMFDAAKGFGWFVRRVLRSSSCLATAVLTNLGDVTARQRKGRTEADKRSTSGDLRLRAIYGWPPIRKGTQVGVGICRYDQRMSIACVIDGAAFSDDKANAFFDNLVAKFAATGCCDH